MFVRVKKRPQKLAFSLVKSERSDGKVIQRTLISLGTVLDPATVENWNYWDGKHGLVWLRYAAFWIDARNKVMAWDPSQWALVRKGICSHLPRHLHYSPLRDSILSVSVRRSIGAKALPKYLLPKNPNASRRKVPQ